MKSQLGDSWLQVSVLTLDVGPTQVLIHGL